ncbi:hypothetical protein CRENBAI_018021 [Crenichthys baileyi]|uniref:Uncharacterized protein n=1 Tax=Crenichthys baileyi TaxID=28760 RepID=A0AAV9SHD5_9TELE
MQANRSKPSTAHQPPRCSHKTRSAAPPTRPATAARRPNHGPEPQKQWKKATAAPVSGHPAGHPHPCMALYGPPSSPAGQSMPAKSPLPEPGTPPSRQTRAQSQGPRSKGTQAIPRERAETPAPAPDSPQDLTPKPSPDPTRGPTPFPTLRPRSPAPLHSPPPEVATDLQQKGASQKPPSGQECGPTPNKGADQPAQRNQNTPHKGGPMTSTPSHPRTQGAQPTERPVPDAGHQTTAKTRQAGQQNTSHSNTEAATKPRPIQNSTPTQKQAPGQDRYMHSPPP